MGFAYRIAQLDQRTALPDQCLHSAEADVRPPRTKSGRHRNCSRAAVDTPSDGVHAGLARSAFEAVSATNLVPINNRAEPFSIRLTDQFGFEWARAP
jgi:hypothetical protein